MNKDIEKKNKLNATFLLNVKNLKENIDLKSKAGLICIRRARAGSNEIILVTNDEFGEINQTFNPLSLLTLFFNKGIDIKAQLIHGDSYGNYPWDHEMGILSGANYDEVKFEEWYLEIKKLCKSKNTRKNRKGRKIFNLLKIYQNAHLLRPKFYEESYLNLLKILDAQGENKKPGAIIVSLKTIKILPKRFVNNIYKEITSAEYNNTYVIPLINKQFNSILKNKNNNQYKISDSVTTNADKLIFVALYTAYRYRNKYIHEGFEFPNKIKDFYDFDSNSAINYFGAGNAEMHLVHYNPKGDSVSIDIHNYLSQKQVKEYQKIYKLLPTWYFLNLIVREILFYRLKKL